MTENRQFRVLQHYDGMAVAYREREPLFCFIENTEQDAVRLAERALDEYRKFIQSPEARQADVEITPQMIDAGVYKLRAVIGTEDRYSDDDDELVRDVFSEMAALVRWNKLEFQKMDVYPASRVFCPMNRNEQDGNICASCGHYDGHKAKVGDASGDAEPSSIFVIECRYPG